MKIPFKKTTFYEFQAKNNSFCALKQVFFCPNDHFLQKFKDQIQIRVIINLNPKIRSTGTMLFLPNMLPGIGNIAACCIAAGGQAGHVVERSLNSRPHLYTANVRQLLPISSARGSTDQQGMGQCAAAVVNDK